jgi:pSer/pThr/pTyr-binding forkhead associated (FHA) protein
MLDKADHLSIDRHKSGPAADGPEAAGDEPTMLLRKRARSRPVAKTGGITVLLTILKGRRQGDVVELRRGDNVIGRGQGAHVHIDDRGVSRHHARLVVGEAGKTEIFDLESTNGTYVNGELVTSGSLHVGDRIRLGADAVLEVTHVASSRARTAVTADERDPDAPMPRRRGSSPDEELPPNSAGPGLAPPCWGYSEAAIDAYGRLLEIRRKRFGDNHPSVAEMLETMGSAFHDNGHHEPALDCLSQALEIRKTHVPPVPEAVARTLTLLAPCELALGHAQAAVGRLQQAEQLLQAGRATPVELGTVRLLLARTLWNLKVEPNRAVALVRLARDAFASGGTMTSLLYQDAQALLTQMG